MLDERRNAGVEQLIDARLCIGDRTFAKLPHRLVANAWEAGRPHFVTIVYCGGRKFKPCFKRSCSAWKGENCYVYVIIGCKNGEIVIRCLLARVWIFEFNGSALCLRNDMAVGDDVVLSVRSYIHKP